MTTVIAKEWTQQGIELKELDDHMLQLYIKGQLIATFSQTGVTMDNILKEIRDYERRN